MPLHINQLPDDCLVYIFVRFALQKQLSTLRGACHRWRAVIDTQICARKRTLQLYPNCHSIGQQYCEQLVSLGNKLKKRGLKQIGHDRDLILAPFGAILGLDSHDHKVNALGLSQLIVGLFSNVEHLVLDVQLYAPPHYSANVLRLIASKWTTLTSLTLSFYLKQGKEQPELHSKLPTLPSLKFLQLSIYNHYFNMNHFADYLAPILTNLEHIHLAYDSKWPIVSRLGPLLSKLPPTCELDFECPSMHSSLEDVLEPALRIGSLSLKSAIMIDVTLICRQFPCLTQFLVQLEVKFMKSNGELGSLLVSRLAPLAHLVTLTLGNIQVDLSCVANPQDSSFQAALHNVRRLSLMGVHFRLPGGTCNNRFRLPFCCKLRKYFPQIDELVLVFDCHKSFDYFKQKQNSHSLAHFPKGTHIFERNDCVKLYAGRHAQRIINSPYLG